MEETKLDKKKRAFKKALFFYYNYYHIRLQEHQQDQPI